MESKEVVHIKQFRSFSEAVFSGNLAETQFIVLEAKFLYVGIKNLI